MMKNVLFAVVATFVLVSSVRADDGLLDGLDTAAISDAPLQMDQAGLDGLDLDNLQNQAGTEKSDEAIEACFRRFGYGGYHHGYRGFSRYHWGGHHWGGYSPCYSYGGYQPYYCYRPVVQYCQPVYRYWGCY